jgi:acyl-CoA thioesterase
MYEADAASRGLGITIDEVRPGGATACMRVAESMLNGHGVAHGGYLFLLADTAFAFACNSHGLIAVARSADVVFVAPARLGDELRAVARECARYGRSGIYDVTVHRADGTLVAEFRGQSHQPSGAAAPSGGEA